MTLFRSRVFADVIKTRIKMRSSGIRVGPESNKSALKRRRQGRSGTHRRDRGKAEAEIGVMQSQTKECLEPQEARKGPSLELPEGARPC